MAASRLLAIIGAKVPDCQAKNRNPPRLIPSKPTCNYTQNPSCRAANLGCSRLSSGSSDFVFHFSAAPHHIPSAPVYINPNMKFSLLPLLPALLCAADTKTEPVKVQKANYELAQRWTTAKITKLVFDTQVTPH